MEKGEEDGVVKDGIILFVKENRGLTSPVSVELKLRLHLSEKSGLKPAPRLFNKRNFHVITATFETLYCEWGTFSEFALFSVFIPTIDLDKLGNDSIADTERSISTFNFRVHLSYRLSSYCHCIVYLVWG